MGKVREKSLTFRALVQFCGDPHQQQNAHRKLIS